MHGEQGAAHHFRSFIHTFIRTAFCLNRVQFLLRFS